MAIPNSSALAALAPAFSPTTTQSVFLLTDPAAFPPREIIASLAESREKSTNEPVTTTVLPSSVCGRALVCACPTPTPAAFHASSTMPRQSPGFLAEANQVTTDSAISGPMPSICDSSSTLACSMASSEPNALAMVRAVGGPSRRMDRATSTRHRSAWRALSISSSIFLVFSAGRIYIGCTLDVPERDTLVSSRTTTASSGTSYSGYSADSSTESLRFLATVGAVQNAGT